MYIVWLYFIMLFADGRLLLDKTANLFLEKVWSICPKMTPHILDVNIYIDIMVETVSTSHESKKYPNNGS
jgi:hypothetical protein